MIDKTRADFGDLEVGDKVTRLISSENIPMPMVVVKIEEGLIYCNTTNKFGDLVIQDGSYWTFDVATGVEVDHDLGWGPGYGITGSRLSKES